MVQYIKLALNNTLLIIKGIMLYNTMRESLFFFFTVNEVWSGDCYWYTTDDQNKAPRYQKEPVLKIRADPTKKRQWIISQDWYNISPTKKSPILWWSEFSSNDCRGTSRHWHHLKVRLKESRLFMFKDFPMNTFKWSCTRVKVRGHKCQMNRNICKF